MQFLRGLKVVFHRAQSDPAREDEQASYQMQLVRRGVELANCIFRPSVTATKTWFYFANPEMQS